MNYQEDINYIKELLSSNKKELAQVLLEKIYLNNPNDFFLENFYGAFLALDKEKEEQAIVNFKRSIKLNSKFSEPYYNLARIYFQRGKYSDSENLLITSIKLDENNYYYKNLLGENYISLKKYNEAINLFNEIIKNQMDNSAAYFNLGFIYHEKEEYNKAIFFYEKSILLDINLSNSYINLSDCYNKTHNHQIALELTTKAINLFKISRLYILHAKNLFNFGKINEGLSYIQEAIDLDSNYLEYYHLYLFNLNYKLNLDLNYYLNFADKFRKKYLEQNQFSKYSPNLKLNKNIKIGFISYDFRRHVVMFQIVDIIKELKKTNKFSLYAYSTNELEDEITLDIKKHFHFWKNISNKNDSEAVGEIRDDQIDILFDLSGYTKGNRIGIFIQRAAPIQISWAGYLNSTGLKDIDYIVGDPYVFPIEEINYFPEKIIRQKHIWTCLSDVGLHKIEKKHVGMITPALKNNYLTFGCFSKISKINISVIDLYSKILKNIINSKLIIQSPQFDDPMIKKYFLNLFNKNKVEDDQIIFIGNLQRDQLLLKYNEIDICLDTFPYGGGTTNLEASWMCVPILTRKGSNFLSRCGESINTNLGLQELIYKNEQECIDKLKKINSDHKNLQLIKENLFQKKKNTCLFNSELFAKNFSEELYKIINKNR
jgi:predicted O-linked N-acetylglucosamine transferase (SPINDLY family)